MEKAREIFQQGVQHGLYARLFKSDDNNSYFEIDLHFLSVGAGMYLTHFSLFFIL